MSNPKLHEAFEEEVKDINIEDLMQEMLGSFNQEKGYTPTPIDEIRIRKMMLARKYIEHEAKRLKVLRDAVKEEWDKRIDKKNEEAAAINDFIEKYLKDFNDGKKLSLDVGTATLKRTAPKTKVIDVERAKKFLKEHGKLDLFLKAPDLDVTLLQDTYLNQFDKMVEKETKERIKKEIEASDKGKITKKREKEIKLEVENDLSDDYFNSLPDFMKYIPESKKLSITMK